MINENKTVEQIREDVNEYLTSIGPSEFPSETQIDEFADEFVSAHKREIAKKESEIAKRDTLIKELEDALEYFISDTCSAYCNCASRGGRRPYDMESGCRYCALVAKVKEAK